MLALLVVALVGSAVARPQNLLPPVFHQPAPAGHALAPGQQHVPASHFRINDAAGFAPASPLSGYPAIHSVQRIFQSDDSGQFSSSHTDSAGTTVQETGSLTPTLDGRDLVLTKTGNFQYTSPEGIPVSLTYTADAQGFHPISSSIPVAPQPIQPTF